MNLEFNLPYSIGQEVYFLDKGQGKKARVASYDIYYANNSQDSIYIGLEQASPKSHDLHTFCGIRKPSEVFPSMEALADSLMPQAAHERWQEGVAASGNWQDYDVTVIAQSPNQQ